MREYNYDFDLNDVELPKSIKEKYKRIKYSIENNQYYMKLLNEICEKENNQYYMNLVNVFKENCEDAYIDSPFIKELLNKLNKNSKEFYNIHYSLMYDEGYYINVFDYDFKEWGIVMSYTKNQIHFHFLG